MKDFDFLEWWTLTNARITSCVNQEELFAQVSREAAQLGFDYFAYGYRQPVPFTRARTVITGTYPSGWLDIYNSNDYGAVDPTIAYSKRGTHLTLWSSESSEHHSRFFGEAREWGIAAGATMTFRGADWSVRILGMAREQEPISIDESALLKLKMKCLAEFIDESRVAQSLAEGHAPILNQREAEILRWVADGKCSKSIAGILDISEHTVNFHIKNIQRKFGATNRVHAAAYAAALGLI